jgi:hypothetical protein
VGIGQVNNDADKDARAMPTSTTSVPCPATGATISPPFPAAYTVTLLAPALHDLAGAGAEVS